MSTLYQIQPRSTETQVNEVEQSGPDSATQQPLGTTQNVQVPPQLLPVFPEVSFTPFQPFIQRFLPKSSLCFPCQKCFSSLSRCLTTSLYSYGTKHCNVQSQQGTWWDTKPHTYPSWICQTLPVKGKVGSVTPAVKPPTFPNLHGQLAFLSKSNTGYRLVC